MTNQQEQDTCGAETEAGTPCKRPGGWGTDEETGFCKFHRGKRIDEVKNEFVEVLENEVISMKKAAKKVGKSASTMRRWRYNDEGFAERVRQAKQRQEELRGEKLKDSVFKRAVEGEATGSEVIFALKNTTDWGDGPDTEVNNFMQQMQGQEQESKQAAAISFDLDVVDNTGDFKEEFDEEEEKGEEETVES